jgi:Domain of unknown function DUF29
MSKYDEDFYAWTQEQAEYLRAGLWSVVDAVHVAEEIEALGKRDWRALESHLKTLILHGLKWTYQPQERIRRGRRWQVSMDNARDAIWQLLRDNQGFEPRLDEAIAWAYPRACRTAQKETGLPRETFPAESPWRFNDLMNEELWQ